MAVPVQDQDSIENQATSSSEGNSQPDARPAPQGLLGRAGAKPSETVERVPILPRDLKPADRPKPQGLLGRAGAEPSRPVERVPILPREFEARKHEVKSPSRNDRDQEQCE